jgi:hypothetical protein
LAKLYNFKREEKRNKPLLCAKERVEERRVNLINPPKK